MTLDALEPFRCAAFARPAGDPAPLPYLADPDDQRHGGFSVQVEMHLRSAAMRAQGLPPLRLSRGDFRETYWTVAQLVTHHASNGCNLRAGDLLGTGTISGATPDSLGSLIELTRNGQSPLALPGGEQRTFLEDGDELLQRGRCERDGWTSIGFGEAVATVLPAVAGA